MTDYIKRAAFFEGQIVGAGDLNLAVSYDRDARARHLRQQHTWGIVTGLELVEASRTTSSATGSKPYKEVTVAPGIAVDGTGRTIVATEELRVAEELFRDSNVAISDAEAWYPVFLQGRDVTGSESLGLPGPCAASGSNRVSEIFEVVFGRVTEVDTLDQRIVPITDGPNDSGTPWKLLLGFVQWDESIGKFTKKADSNEGAGRRYVGVRAGDVTGIGGQLTLRSGERGDTTAPGIQITGGDKPQLIFGAQKADGAIQEVMKVDVDGNLTVTGKIVGALAGGVQVESGLATDGMLLPLPKGITQEQVDDGDVVIQATVTPRIQRPAGLTPAAIQFPHFYECFVDGRRVHCRVRWIATSGPTTPFDLPGVCNYQVMAFPRSSGGA